jgi:hypothetical protein
MPEQSPRLPPKAAETAISLLSLPPGSAPVSSGAVTLPVRGRDSARRGRTGSLWPTLGLLSVVGLLLEGLYLALYPLLAEAEAANNLPQQVLRSLFPWLSQLYWTQRWPALWSALRHLPLLGAAPATVAGRLLLAVLLLAWLLNLLAARIGQRCSERLLERGLNLTFCLLVLPLTALFGLTFLCAPAWLSRDMLLYALYSKQAILAHVNPYLNLAGPLPAHEPLTALIRQGVSEQPLYGPLWLDICLSLVLLARAGLPQVLLNFRLFLLVLHLMNTLLLWSILGRLAPRWRLAGTLLYAWSPAVLLLGISEVHSELLLLCFLLLGLYCFQRGLPLLSWIFWLLMALVRPLFLLPLPILLALLWRETRTWPRRWRWRLALVLVTLLVVPLAFLPYWQGWGLEGLVNYLAASFLPGTALNSLEAALLRLPAQLPVLWLWLLAPARWLLLVLLAMLALLLLGLWLSDAPALAMLFTGLLLLLLVALFPVYWPWYVLWPLPAALCARSWRVLLLAVLLEGGALLSYVLLLQQPLWAGGALLTLGLPLLIWGWTLFVTAVWRTLRSRESGSGPTPAVRRPRPPWRSWPSRPPLSPPAKP